MQRCLIGASGVICSGAVAVAQVGACCLDDGGGCIEAAASECASAGGLYKGDGTDCATGLCTPTDCSFVLLGALDASHHPAIQGANITTDGVFYQNERFGTSDPPLSSFIDLVGPTLEYDSYITLDGFNTNGQGRASSGSDHPLGAYTAKARSRRAMMWR